MQIYLLITFTQLLGFFSGRSKLLTFLFGTLLVFVAGLRVNTGFDLENYYENWWVRANNDFWSWKKEPLLHITWGALGKLGFEFWHGIFFCAILSIIGKCYVFNRMSSLPFWSLIIYYSDYFYFQEMGQIRSAMSAFFVFLFYFNYAQGRRFTAYSYWVIAALFHISSIPTLVGVWLVHFKNRYSLQRLAFFIFIVVTLALLGPDFIIKWLRPLEQNSLYLEYLISRFSIDVSNNFGSPGEILAVILLGTYWWLFKGEAKDVYRDILFNSYFLGVLFLILSSTYGDMMGRFARPLLMVNCLLIPYLYTHYFKKDKLNYQFVYALIFAYSMMKVSLIFSKRGADLLPYVGVWMG